jgi:NAD(P)-dependent dehydrogenase (short-subunit alcohol dehydrogenase family)
MNWALRTRWTTARRAARLSRFMIWRAANSVGNSPGHETFAPIREALQSLMPNRDCPAWRPIRLTAMMKKPGRLVYLSPGLHRGAGANLDDVAWTKRRWNGTEAYSETELHDVLLAFGIARRWPDVLSNALDPGWVPTRMGGASAPDDLDQAHGTQAWLAVSGDAEAGADLP